MCNMKSMVVAYVDLELEDIYHDLVQWMPTLSILTYLKELKKLTNSIYYKHFIALVNTKIDSLCLISFFIYMIMLSNCCTNTISHSKRCDVANRHWWDTKTLSLWPRAKVRIPPVPIYNYITLLLV